MIVLAAFYKNSKLRTTTNLVIISMATADLLVGCVVIPMWLYGADLSFMTGPPFKKWHIKFFDAYQYIDQSLGLNSIYQLVLLHGLRSYSIAFPLRHRQLNNSKFVNFFKKNLETWKEKRKLSINQLDITLNGSLGRTV